MPINNSLHVVVGASAKPKRPSHQAVQRLVGKGYNTMGIHPLKPEISSVQCLANLKEINDKVDTITLYLSPNLQDDLIEDIQKIHPRRVIFNPGTENPKLAQKIEQMGIQTVEACTLVLLSTDQY